MRKYLIYMVFVTLLILLIYTLAFICDLIIQSFIIESSWTNKAAVVTRERLKTDYLLRENARENHFKSTVYPALFGADWNFLAQKYNSYPLGGLPYTNTYYCNEGYGLVKYKSDRYGFRNSDSIYRDKIELMLVGDSFVQGACVRDENTISENLTKFGIKTINMGMAADSPLTYASRTKVFTEIIRPKYLVINFYLNDNLNYLFEEKYYQHYFLKNNTNYVLKNNDLTPELKSLYQEAAKYEEKIYQINKNQPTPEKPKLNIAGSLKLENSRILISNYMQKLYFKIPDMAKLAIDTARQECERNNCIPIISYIPASKFWDSALVEDEFKNSLKIYANSQKIIFADCSKYIDSNDPENYAPQGPHLSIAGYRKAAKCIYESLPN